MTEADNIKFTRNKQLQDVGYQKYDNYDAIEVPITFLGKYSPEQFELVGNMDDHSEMKSIGVNPLSEDFIAGYRAVGGTGTQRAGGYWVGLTNPNRFPFKRIFIRHRR